MKRTSKAKKSTLTVNKRILILCEGKTECGYFTAFKKDPDLKASLSAVDVDAYQPTDFSPLGLIDEAKRRKKEAHQKKNPFNSIWIVFDRDGHHGVSEAFQSAIDTKINKAFSSVCFEFWIILHFEFTTRSFKNGDEVVSYLKSRHYPLYKKGQNFYINLKPRIDTAIKHAKKICDKAHEDIEDGHTKLCDYNPYTNIHELVLELQGKAGSKKQKALAL